MSNFGIVLGQLTQFFVMILVGWLSARLGVLSMPTLEGLSRLLMRVLFPLLIFTNAVNGASRAQILACLPMLALSVALYAALSLLVWLIARLCRLTGERSKVFQACFLFGNMGFMGIPLLTALFPQTGGLYVVVFTIIDQLMLWTYGIYLTTPKQAGRGFDPKAFLNPALGAVVLALVLIFAGLSLPSLLLTPLSTIGKASTPISLIYLGGLLHFTQWQKTFARKEVYLGMLGKLVLFPLLFAWGASLVFSGVEMIQAMAIIAGLPTMSTIAMFAQSQNNQGEYATGIVMATSLVSLLSLTLVSFLIFR